MGHCKSKPTTKATGLVAKTKKTKLVRAVVAAKADKIGEKEEGGEGGAKPKSSTKGCESQSTP